MPILEAGVLYFAIVFATGFVLGTIRTLWVVPRVGARTAELMEAPCMLAATILASRWAVAHFRIPSAPAGRIEMGAIGLTLLLAAELGLVLGLRRLSVRQYIATRDKVSGLAYCLLLAFFAIAPLIV
jgi:hypothetical protein